MKITNYIIYKFIMLSVLIMTTLMLSVAFPAIIRADSVADCVSSGGTIVGGNCVAGGITNPVIGSYGNNPLAAESGITFVTIFIRIWQTVNVIGGFLVLLNFIWAGIDWISAGGDSGKTGKARDKITQSIIGLIILLGAFVIITFVGQLFFGDAFDILNPNLETITNQP